MQTEATIGRVIGFGFLATFVSSLGQTFFLGLFGDRFGLATGVDATTVSLLYGVATLTSGSLLFWLGGALDRIELPIATAATLALLAAGCLLLASTGRAATLLLAFFLLRLAGQGLLTQIAIVAAARNGGARRGRAIAWSSMGVILGEAVLPAVVVALLDVLDWRAIWLAAAAVVAALVLPTALVLQRGIRWRDRPRPAASASDASGLGRRALLTDARFWAGAAILLLPPFMATGFLFEQARVAKMMGWPPGAIGAAFTVFALARAFGTWFYGRASDRFGAGPMTRLHLLPMALAFGALALPLGSASIWTVFAGVGFTTGANSVLSGAVWVELFGTAALGMVRGVFGAMMVLASALAPVTVAGMFALGLGAAGLGAAFALASLVIPLAAGPFVYRRVSD